MVDELLASLQLIQLEDLKTLTAAHCSCTEDPYPIEFAEGITDNSLQYLIRLDLTGCLNTEE